MSYKEESKMVCQTLKTNLKWHFYYQHCILNIFCTYHNCIAYIVAKQLYFEYWCSYSSTVTSLSYQGAEAM